MDNLIKKLTLSVSSDNSDRNLIAKNIELNPYRRMLHEVLLERKDILRSRMNLVSLFDNEEPSSDIEEILAQFDNPTFPLEEVNSEKDEEWLPLERKYFDGINKIKEDTIMKQMQLEKDMEIALAQSEEVLRNHRDFRPIDERDLCNIRQSIRKRFEHSKCNLRGEAATKVLVLRREIEQQGRKRRNFDKVTTDILQNWFHYHRHKPYPSDQEKAELAKQCNIKISQVNNWFGNQRIRSKQQALKMLEEQNEREAALAAEENPAMANIMSNVSVPATQNLGTSGVMNIPLVNSNQMQSMVLPVQPTLLNNSNGFLQQPPYFSTGGQMPVTDNGNGQQFYDFEAFGLIKSEAEQFNQMNYLG